MHGTLSGCHVKSELLGEDLGGSRQLVLSAGCQQYIRTSVQTAALLPPLSATICTTILARMSTSWRIFLCGGKSEGEEG